MGLHSKTLSAPPDLMKHKRSSHTDDGGPLGPSTRLDGQQDEMEDSLPPIRPTFRPPDIHPPDLTTSHRLLVNAQSLTFPPCCRPALEVAVFRLQYPEVAAFVPHWTQQLSSTGSSQALPADHPRTIRIGHAVCGNVDARC
jgi:hypothetical protein